MTTIHIPASIEEASDALTGIESLLTRKGWERAAIVAAFVRKAQGQRTSLGSQGSLTVEGFARLGIVGLRDPNTVRAHVQNWLDAHDGVYPEPGAEVTIPTDPWPPTGSESVGEQSKMTPERRERLLGAGTEAGMKSGAKVVDIAANPKSLALAIKADPETARAAAAALEEAKRESLREAVIGAGGNPDMPMDDLGIDRVAVEAGRLQAGIRAIAADLRRLHLRAEPDQWARIQAGLAPDVENLSASLLGVVVPDSLAGVEL